MLLWVILHLECENKLYLNILFGRGTIHNDLSFHVFITFIWSKYLRSNYKSSTCVLLPPSPSSHSHNISPGLLHLVVTCYPHVCGNGDRTFLCFMIPFAMRFHDVLPNVCVFAVRKGTLTDRGRIAPQLFSTCQNGKCDFPPFRLEKGLPSIRKDHMYTSVIIIDNNEVNYFLNV